MFPQSLLGRVSLLVIAQDDHHTTTWSTNTHRVPCLLQLSLHSELFWHKGLHSDFVLRYSIDKAGPAHAYQITQIAAISGSDSALCTLYYLGPEGSEIMPQRVLGVKAMCPLFEVSSEGGRMICSFFLLL